MGDLRLLGEETGDGGLHKFRDDILGIDWGHGVREEQLERRQPERVRPVNALELLQKRLVGEYVQRLASRVICH